MKTIKEFINEGYTVTNDKKRPTDDDVLGEFVEVDHKNRFQIYPLLSDDSWAKSEGATHQIHSFNKSLNYNIGGDYGFRYVKIKKTVVQVMVDEDENGKPVWEKWNIRDLKWYDK